MSFEKRIKTLEARVQGLEWQEKIIEITVKDGRRDPLDPIPDRLGMVIKVTPTGGRTFYRGEDESETDFIERSRQ